MKLPMILVAFGPALILGFLVSFTKAFGNPFEYGTRPEPGHLSGIGPRDSPPDYGPPSYGYGYPPPYQYETSTSTATLIISPGSSTCECSMKGKTKHDANNTGIQSFDFGDYHQHRGSDRHRPASIDK